MIYRRKTYKVLPEQIDLFTEFFRDYLLPNQLKNGARMVGRWVSEGCDEIVSIWEYNSMEEYQQIEERVRQDELYPKAKARRAELGELFVESKTDFLHPTVPKIGPQHVLGGELRKSEDTLDVQWVRLDPSNVAEYVTRPHARSRLLDAMNGTGMTYEAFRAKPHELLFRLSAE